MSDWKAKRFWKAAEAVALEGGFEVRLDGRSVKTPAKAALILPTLAMAEAVAAEWQAQEKEIKPDTMPVTRSANAAIDKVRLQHGEVAQLLADYGDSDLLCYRAEGPDGLVARQAAAWDPLLDWLERQHDIRLQVRAGVMHIAQEATQLARLRKLVDRFDAFELTAFHDLVSLSGSLVIGLAATGDDFKVEDLWQISRVDELWQEDQWGPDDEASANAEIKRQAFFHAARFFRLARD